VLSRYHFRYRVASQRSDGFENHPCGARSRRVGKHLKSTREDKSMLGGQLLTRLGVIALASIALGVSRAPAEGTVKIGLILPMTGQQASTGKQINAAVQLFVKQHGTQVAGKTVEVILKDDASLPDNTKRFAQELIVNDKVAVIAGFGITPSALSAAPLATQAKIPEVVMAAGTSIITERSPYIVRTSFTLPQSSVIMADWAAKNAIRKVVTIVSDYAPGIDSENSFKARFSADGGSVVEAIRVPFQNPDFSPFLQRARDDAPDAVFVFVPSGQGGTFVKQFIERGLSGAGIKFICTGDVTDDDQLNGMGDAVIGTISAGPYSAAHPSDENARFVAAFKEANGGLRPNFMAVGGYDGMHLIYQALAVTKGATDGDALMAAMKGMAWESPRGPISIDPQTRDIIQNIEIRKVENRDGELYNIEFETFKAVKDPAKAAMAGTK
jgi:branched-chain amino acid transport system substrate-binding protein